MNLSTEFKVLISAYACEPEGGSEATIGWKFINEIAHKNKVWVITRESNRKSIESIEKELIHSNIKWIYFDYPESVRFWKRGASGLRLYYYLWQIGIYFKIKKTNKNITFDIIHHVTFVNYWMPSFLTFLPVPFVWGPVGGGESVAYKFYKSFNQKHKIYEVLRNLGHKIHSLNPILRINAHRTAIAIAANHETAQKMGKIGYKNIITLSQVAVDNEQFQILSNFDFKNSGIFRFYTVGRLIPLKGIPLAIEAFANLAKKVEHIEYLIIGDGEEKKSLLKLVEKLNLTNKVKILGFKHQKEVFEIMKTCDVLVFPSLHDSGGLAVTESMAAGKPVICLDIGGPGVQVTNETGIKISLTTPEQIVRDIEKAMTTLYENEDLRNKMSNAGKNRVENDFTWVKKGEVIQGCYHQICQGKSGK